MKLKTIVVALLAVFALAACSSKSSDEGVSVKEKAPGDMKTLVNDYSTGKAKAKNASITSEQLIVTEDNGKETTYELPDKEFFVSIAPYVTQTHP